jgi:hypothetical protein
MFQEFWAFMPVRGTSMNKPNLAILYSLGALLSPLASISVILSDPVDLDLVKDKASLVRKTLAVVLNDYSTLETSKDSGRELLRLIDDLNQWYTTTRPVDRYKPNKEVDDKCKRLVTVADTFQTTLIEELRGFLAYIPSQKYAYSTRILVETAEGSLPPPVLNRMTNGNRRDMREGGRCLAFDLPTAAGFHFLRAMERVLDQYAAIANPTFPFKSHDWGELISALHKVQDMDTDKDAKDHARKVHALFQLIKQERNLIIHPEADLNVEEALAFFNLAQTTITTMAERLPELKGSD